MTTGNLTPERENLIEKIEAFRFATNELIEAWYENSDVTGSAKYPFENSFDEINISECAESFIEEIKSV